VFEVFAKYIMGQVPLLPWCEVPLQSETSTISTDLVAINRAGYLTINSQVRIFLRLS
jgi:methylenetetrahydrofolate reductase (NADPH)